MEHFFLYLFETGICLAVLYTAYWLLLKREALLGFNRIFLIASIALALTVPLYHLNVMLNQDGSMIRTATGILEFRYSYEEVIGMIDADFGAEPGLQHQGKSLASGWEFGWPEQRNLKGSGFQRSTEGSVGNDQSGMSFARILLYIYLMGVMFFLARFLHLVIRLFRLINKNKVTRQQGFRMVEIGEDISPFSFFRYLFINREGFSAEDMGPLLEHEKAHIHQKHSMDHLLAHGLAVFQWFNPIAWQIRKALKQTHEYIADRQVIMQGFNATDYQSLLLRQVIGYHSVELVNNFNLKPIKQRMMMMNKLKPRRAARLKAMLVLPFALLLFLLFADFTLRGPGEGLTDLGQVIHMNKASEKITGLWEMSGGTAGEMINFNGELLYLTEKRFRYLEDPLLVRELFWRREGNRIFISYQEGGSPLDLRIEVREGELFVHWWGDERYLQYHRSNADNTLDAWIQDQEITVELTDISHFRIMDNPDHLFYLIVGRGASGGFVVKYEGEEIELKEVSKIARMEMEERTVLDRRKMSVMLCIDKNTPMSLVRQLKDELREAGALKIAEAGYPHPSRGIAVSPMLYHTVGLPRLLPPAGVPILEKEEARRQSFYVHEINLSSEHTSPAGIEHELIRFIREHKEDKYVFSLEYEGNIQFGQYIEIVDLVFKVVYGFRDELAMAKYNLTYRELGSEAQSEIRQTYKMVLSEAWRPD